MCHSGVGVGGGMLQKFGVAEDYWLATGSTNIDKGGFDVAKDPADLYVFRVPSLRNVAMTAPYSGAPRSGSGKDARLGGSSELTDVNSAAQLLNSVAKPPMTV
jgi:cytochrome c peroxidase